MLDGIDHGPAVAMFVDEEVQKLINFIVLVRRDAQHVVMMFVVIYIDEALGRFIEVIISSDMVLVGYLGQQLGILDVCPADVDIEEYDITVLFLLFDQITELWFNIEEGLGQALARGHAVHGQVYRGHTRMTDLVYEDLVHEIPVGGQIHEEPLFRTVADDLQNEIFAQQRLAAHKGNYPAAEGLKPIHRILGRFNVHTWQVIVILKAVVAVYITAPLGEEVAEDWSELTGVNAGVYIGEHPASDGADTV